jgi:hypothetical protein
MALRRPLAPAFNLFHKIITSEAASVGGLFYFKPSVQCLHLAVVIPNEPAFVRYWGNSGHCPALTLDGSVANGAVDGA